MSQLILNIENDNILDKLLWMLKHFESDGVKIEKYKDDMVDSVVGHYENKKKNEVESTIDYKVVQEYAQNHNLTGSKEDFWNSLK